MVRKSTFKRVAVTMCPPRGGKLNGWRCRATGERLARERDSRSAVMIPVKLEGEELAVRVADAECVSDHLPDGVQNEPDG